MTNGPGLSQPQMSMSMMTTPVDGPKNETEAKTETGAWKPKEKPIGKSEDESEATSGDKSVDKSDGVEKQESKDGEKSRTPIVRVDQRFSREEWKYRYVRTSRTSKKISGKYALVVRQVFNIDGEYEETVVDVRGGDLRDILAAMLQGAEGLRLNEKPALIEPRLLYHCSPQLRQRLDEEASAETKNDALIFDIKAALQLVTEDFSTEEASIESLKSKGEITFETLWAIFRPNELVYTLDQLSESCVFRAVDHRIRKKPDGSKVFWIGGRKIDTNGKSFGWAKINDLEIPSFPGAKAISDLPVYPIRFHTDGVSIREELLSRGRKRLLLHKRGFYDYGGHALRERELNGRVYFEKFNSHGRVIIDHEVFSQIQAKSFLVPKIDHGLFEEQLTDDQLITLPSMVYGFSLGDKIWGGFAVSRIKEIKWDDSIWDSLVLPDPQKRVMRTLVKNHVTHRSLFDDFVRGKGKGLIGLLTGPPGVGKTLTAEAVAEIVERPLYMLSSGELGDDPHQIDEKLKEILELTQTWNAVLLLDEADVFLTRRSDADITRNAIVSIFLRQLEYYQGILILTTNRVEAIDDAFQSRIHFCYSYPELNPQTRKSIWLGFLQNAENSGIALDIPAAGVDELACMNTNGRQIKNVMKAAQSIAIEEKQPLTVEGIKMVAETLQGFNFR